MNIWEEHHLRAGDLKHDEVSFIVYSSYQKKGISSYLISENEIHLVQMLF